MLWSEAAFSACLAWHWPDHYWQLLQCNWRVAWTFLRMCADKRWTLRSNIVTLFNHMTRGITVYVTRFNLDCFGNYHTSNFRKVERQHTEGMVGSITWFCWKFTWLSSSVIATSLEYYFLAGHSVYTYTIRMYTRIVVPSTITYRIIYGISHCEMSFCLQFQINSALKYFCFCLIIGKTGKLVVAGISRWWNNLSLLPTLT